MKHIMHEFSHHCFDWESPSTSWCKPLSIARDILRFLDPFLPWQCQKPVRACEGAVAEVVWTLTGGGPSKGPSIMGSFSAFVFLVAIACIVACTHKNKESVVMS
jgi:hypothetical protein